MLARRIIILLFAGAGIVHAQDQIYKTDNTKLLVKVLEVGTDEIRYKRHDNLSGPTYIESKKNVSLIVFENGQHQVITQTTIIAPEQQVVPQATVVTKIAQPFDSAAHYKHRNIIGINFLNFFNNEIGGTFRREAFQNQFAVVIPFAFGLSKPTVTQTFYFNSGNSFIEIHNKIFEVGFGVHYYPSLRTKVNYYIGPMYRHLQFAVTQQSRTNSWPAIVVDANETTLSRHAFTITNGLVYRTKSRLSTNIFMSMGFKNDVVADPLRDPSGNPIRTIANPLGFYWWGGFEVAFGF